jgi:hypothetical protein
VKLFRIAAGSAVAIALVGVSALATPVAAQDDCVSIYGGDIVNDTSIWISADAGTAISDASAGSNNLATTSGGGGEGSINTASAGNGGVATAAANGGAVSTGNINSGGNVGNAVDVGDTVCGAAADYGDGGDYAADAGYDAGGEVTALPDTGAGFGDLSGLIALLGSAGAAAASFGLRRR